MRLLHSIHNLFRIMLLIYILSFGKLSYSQGGWNINYIPIDSVTNKVLGKEIRVDFTPSLVKDSLRGINIRRLLLTKDTARLIVNNKPVKFKENWKIYSDQGFLKDQS